MSHPYWGTCFHCHRLMYEADYFHELVLYCPVHAYSQHFRKRPELWNPFQREKLFKIIEVAPLERNYRELHVNLMQITGILTSMNVNPDEVITPREQWDYFYWHNLTIQEMKGGDTRKV